MRALLIHLTSQEWRYVATVILINAVGWTAFFWAGSRLYPRQWHCAMFRHHYQYHHVPDLVVCWHCGKVCPVDLASPVWKCAVPFVRSRR